MTPQERESVAREAWELLRTLLKQEDKHKLRLFTQAEAMQLTAAAMPILIQNVRMEELAKAKPFLPPKPVPYREDVFPPGHPKAGQKRNGGASW